MKRSKPYVDDPLAPPYCYRGLVTRVIDGDTVEIDLDFGLHLTQRIVARLAGINARETKGAERDQGLADAEALEALVETYGPTLLVYTSKDAREKFGRYLVTLVGLDDNGHRVDLNARMLADGHARPYEP